MAGRKVVHHRALWISDVHLGSASNNAKKLLDFLQHNEAERLYLVGDIFDGWKLQVRFRWTPEESQVVNAVLDKAHRGTRIYYIAGNHDGFLRKFLRRPLQFGMIRLVNETVHTTADGRRLLVLHGDAFDDVVSALPNLSKAADRAYGALVWLNQRLDVVTDRLGKARWPLSATAKTLVKGAVQYLSGFDDQVVRRCRREQLQGVICGHTHHAEARGLRDDIISYNCGDWVESYTALAEDFHGRISILKGAEAPRPRAAAPEKAPTLARKRSGPLIVTADTTRRNGFKVTRAPAPTQRPERISAAEARRGTPAHNHRSEFRPHL